jgi:hypothetical protein
MTDVSELMSIDLAEHRAWALDLVGTRPQIDLLMVDAINAATSVDEIDRLLAGRKRRRQRSAPVHASALPVQLELNLELGHSGVGHVEMLVAAETHEPSGVPPEESSTAFSTATASTDRETELAADCAVNSSPDVPAFERGRRFADNRPLPQRSFCRTIEEIPHSVRGPPDQCDRPHGGAHRRHATAQPRSPPRRSPDESQRCWRNRGLPSPHWHSAEP